MIGLFDEFKTFLDSIHFVRSYLLWLMPLPLFLMVIRRAFIRYDRLKWISLGRPAALSMLRITPTRGRKLSQIAFFLTWCCLTVASAGPQWGEYDEQGVAIGRDYVFVIDLSRSMWAQDMRDSQQPSRWQSAIKQAREIISQFRTQGGHRVAVVIFAARPKILVPLTTDYDHVDFRLSQLDASVQPADLRPDSDDSPSGTRIGAAIEKAVEVLDSQFAGFQDIFLFTDADDPANDGEWRNGTTLARSARIPVHVVGIGDPRDESFIYQKGVPLEFRGENGIPVPITTRLNEELAKSIARDADGIYWPVQREEINGQEFLKQITSTSATRELQDERLPQPRDRSYWFLVIALILLVVIWCTAD